MKEHDDTSLPRPFDSAANHSIQRQTVRFSATTIRFSGRPFDSQNLNALALTRPAGVSPPTTLEHQAASQPILELLPARRPSPEMPSKGFGPWRAALSFF